MTTCEMCGRWADLGAGEELAHEPDGTHYIEVEIEQGDDREGGSENA